MTHTLEEETTRNRNATREVDGLVNGDVTPGPSSVKSQKVKPWERQRRLSSSSTHRTTSDARRCRRHVNKKPIVKKKKKRKKREGERTKKQNRNGVSRPKEIEGKLAAQVGQRKIEVVLISAGLVTRRKERQIVPS